MTVDLTALLAVRRSTLGEGLQRLSLPPQLGDETPRAWELVPRANHYRPVANLLEFVATGGHLGGAGDSDASTVVRFEPLLGGGLRTINLS